MSANSDLVTVQLPRSVTTRLPELSAHLTDRMHDLLERNTNEALSAEEREELETLVHMAHVSEILSMACRTPFPP